jgi:hypothetical protein
MPKSEMSENAKIFFSWEDLVATYRGKQKKDAAKLNFKKVRQFSLMMRSFFDQQDGDFEMVLKSITAIKKTEKRDQESQSTYTEKTNYVDVERQDSSNDHAQHILWPTLIRMMNVAITIGLCIVLYKQIIKYI